MWGRRKSRGFSLRTGFVLAFPAIVRIASAPSEAAVPRSLRKRRSAGAYSRFLRTGTVEWPGTVRILIGHSLEACADCVVPSGLLYASVLVVAPGRDEKSLSCVKRVRMLSDSSGPVLFRRGIVTPAHRVHRGSAAPTRITALRTPYFPCRIRSRLRRAANDGTIRLLKASHRPCRMPP